MIKRSAPIRRPIRSSHREAAAPVKRRNVQDATLKNTRRIDKDIDRLAGRVEQIETIIDVIVERAITRSTKIVITQALVALRNRRLRNSTGKR